MKYTRIEKEKKVHLKNSNLKAANTFIRLRIIQLYIQSDFESHVFSFSILCSNIKTNFIIDL